MTRQLLPLWGTAGPIVIVSSSKKLEQVGWVRIEGREMGAAQYFITDITNRNEVSLKFKANSFRTKSYLLEHNSGHSRLRERGAEEGRSRAGQGADRTAG